MPIYEILCKAYDYLRGVKSELLDDINEGYYDEDEMNDVDEMIEKTFEGSLPAFVAAFTKKKELSKKDVEEIRQMLDQFEKKV